MRLELVPRQQAPPLAQALAPVGAFCAAILIGGIVIAAMGRSPAQAFVVFFVEPLTQSWSLQEIALKATPLVIIAIGLSFCFRANLWNIGAEGQFIMGALAGAIVPLATHGTQAGHWVLGLALIMGVLGGAAYALIPALLRVAFGVSEILTSLMLVYVAQQALDYLVRGPWRDPKGFNFPQSVVFDQGATMPVLLGDGRLHLGVGLALAVVVVAWFVLNRTLFGFGIKVAGESARAARFSGFNADRLVLAAFAVSGGLAGLAGIVEVTAQIGQLQPSISPGYGFTAITVAFLGRLQPFGILFAALVVALAVIGGESAQVAMKLPLDLTNVFQGILLMCVLAANALVTHRLRLVRKASA
jgi:general nucleoside transport system permease protein